ncbi:MAG: hypothetical protein OXG58_00895 [Gemmatimonadetes bacterium]|nr:hypothetical protein [Gemmatimonadota bacterium]MCY3942324.1 hypothetical protein [Gemmatimonadota bacterium]
MEVPLGGGIGLKQQVLTWNSDGAWTLFEVIGYDDVDGDETTVRSSGLPIAFAAGHQTLLHDFNEREGTRLWELGREGRECGIGRSRVTFHVRDNPRDSIAEWQRCAGRATSLKELDEREVTEPDDGAAGVVYLATRARDLAFGKDFDDYAYTGSLPFGTVDKGTQTEIKEQKPRLFRSPDGRSAPAEWVRIWDEHRPGSSLPEVDWAGEMVVLATAGPRHELGDSIEVRKVLLVGEERDIFVEVVQRVPGDYCAPARRDVWPYHIVVTPRREGSFSFALRVERVPCGV